MEKRGLSPVIASVLLIAIVVVLAAIIFIWARGFVTEGVGKFGEPVERACNDVKFEAGIFPDGNEWDVDINNQGDIPLHGFDFKSLGIADVIVTEYIGEAGQGTGSSVSSGESKTLDLSAGFFNEGDKVLVVPIILGETDSGRVAYTCGDQYGVGVTI